MSSVKKLSLSGFKSTFRRKISRDNSRNYDNSQQANVSTQRREVCENESTITRNNHANFDQNGIDHPELAPKEIRGNGVADGQQLVENKRSRWRLRQRATTSNKSSCGTIGIVDTASHTPVPGSGNYDADDISVNSNGAIGGNTPQATQQSLSPVPLANGHVHMTPSEISGIDSGYVGTRLSKIPPQFVNHHTFHEVEKAPHDYINDAKMKLDDKQCRGCDGEKERKTSEDTQSHSSNLTSLGTNLRCDVNDNSAEFFEEALDQCLENNDDQQLRADVDCDDGVDRYEALEAADTNQPPAIPPKPTALFTNGQWVLENSRPVPEVCVRRDDNKDSPDAEQHQPPRPPARSRTRHGVDLTLPFYKKYLEQKENAIHPAPIYEDVRVDYGLGGGVWGGPVGASSGGLAGELSKLPRQPWYWGPLSQEEAEEKLDHAAAGSFLVRDSSDERYLLTLSFKSSGRCLHTRIEHRNGLFSLNDSEGHPSVVALIHSAVSESQEGVYGYMNDSTGTPARLTQWVSRFSEVKSLQHLCRFVIRETYPRHHIRHLPLPKKINEYILQNQY